MPTFIQHGSAFPNSDLSRYILSGPFYLNLGVDAQGGPAVVRIGANDAARGRGILQIGGAGAKDGGNGSYLYNDSYPGWNVLTNSIDIGPTEFNIYGGAAGRASSAGATTITRLTGPIFVSQMVGKTFWFDGAGYTVVSVDSDSSLTVNTTVPAGTKMWNFQLTYGSGTCSVSGTTMRRVMGDTFIPSAFGSGFQVTINGVNVTATFVDTDTYTLAVAPGDTSLASYTYSTNVNNQVVTRRMQLSEGSDEENLSEYATPFAYRLGAQQSGIGRLKPYYITSEYQDVFEAAAYGKYVSLGGITGSEALRAVYAVNTVNRFEVYGAGTGVSPNFRTRSGTDTNVSFGIDTQGTGQVVFTSGSFGRINFKVFGSAGNDYLGVDANTGAPFISANGVSTNIDIRAIPKGTGLFNVTSGGYSFAGTKVVGARQTGWTAATGTATRATFLTSTVTLPVLAEHVKALIDDLTTHGLIGT